MTTSAPSARSSSPARVADRPPSVTCAPACSARRSNCRSSLPGGRTGDTPRRRGRDRTGHGQAGTRHGLVEFASMPVASVIPRTRASSSRFTGRQQARSSFRVQRARAAGVSHSSDAGLGLRQRAGLGQAMYPRRMDLAVMARYARRRSRGPATWPAGCAAGDLPDLTVPNMAAAGEPCSRLLRRLPGVAAGHAALLGRDRWLRRQWTAVHDQGIMRPDDARRAVDIGATAVSVSNTAATTWTALRLDQGAPAVAGGGGGPG